MRAAIERRGELDVNTRAVNGDVSSAKIQSFNGEKDEVVSVFTVDDDLSKECRCRDQALKTGGSCCIKAIILPYRRYYAVGTITLIV